MTGVVKTTFAQRRAEGGKGDCPPKKISKTKKYYKIVKKWSENASREVQK